MKAFASIVSIGAILGIALGTPIHIGDTAVERRNVEVDDAAPQVFPFPTIPYVPVLPSLAPTLTIPTLPTLALPTLPSLILPTSPVLPPLPTLAPIPIPTTPDDLISALRIALTQIINILTAISKLLYSWKPITLNAPTNRIYQGVPFLTPAACLLCLLCHHFPRSLASKSPLRSSRLHSPVFPRLPMPFSLSWHSSKPRSEPSRRSSATRLLGRPPTS